MSFASPLSLLIMLALLAVLGTVALTAGRRRGRSTIAFTNLDVLASVAPSVRRPRRRLVESGHARGCVAIEVRPTRGAFSEVPRMRNALRPIGWCLAVFTMAGCASSKDPAGSGGVSGFTAKVNGKDWAAEPVGVTARAGGVPGGIVVTGSEEYDKEAADLSDEKLRKASGLLNLDDLADSSDIPQFLAIAREASASSLQRCDRCSPRACAPDLPSGS